MDKPISLPIKDFLIRKMSVKLNISETIIDAIVSHQFKNANEALKSNNTIEFSGLGKFIFNEKKALKRLKKSEDIEASYIKMLSSQLTDVKRKYIETKLKSIREYIETLKPKINVV